LGCYAASTGKGLVTIYGQHGLQIGKYSSSATPLCEPQISRR